MFYYRLRAILILGLIFLGLSFCDDLEGALQDGIEEPAGTAVIWAKPLWAKTSSGASGCPAGYTFLGNDFCYQCDPGFVFGRFPDDDFCWKCPPGTSPQPFGENYTCR